MQTRRLVTDADRAGLNWPAATTRFHSALAGLMTDIVWSSIIPNPPEVRFVEVAAASALRDESDGSMGDTLN